MRDAGPIRDLIAGAIGPPGRRTFYLEVHAGTGRMWFLLEKDQVAALADRSLAMVAELAPDIIGSDIPDRNVDDPEEVVFRVGEIMILASESTDRVGLVLRAATDEDEPPAVRFDVTPGQLHRMAVAARRVVARGRPPCPYCGRPLDPDGHVCPASNGHLRARRR